MLLPCPNTLCVYQFPTEIQNISRWSPAIILERAQTHREGQSNGEEGGQLALQPPHDVLPRQPLLGGRQEAEAAPRHRQEDEGRHPEEGI